MKVKIDSSTIVKPCYDGKPPSTTSHIPLSVFDKVTFDTHIAVIYAYRPPTTSNHIIKEGLQKALAVYREWAGKLIKDDKGESVILLNDGGVRFIEASVDNRLDQVMPLKPTPALLSLHPSLNGAEKLVQIQITRFTCGSMVVGFTADHLIADGHATCNFLVAWGMASRGVEVSPLPTHDRTIFTPRDPPVFKFEHKGAEFLSKDNKINHQVDYHLDDIVVHKVHFTKEFLMKLKAHASSVCNGKLYTTFESLLAHLWRTITRARGLSGFETSTIRLSVNGRTRLKDPSVTYNYFGNLVLWAFPRARVKDLVNNPLSYVVKLIHDSITKVNEDYFKSFIDFASHKAKSDGLVPTASMDTAMHCPSLEVDSWLRFPFYDLDFGGGCPYIFMPTYFPIEGLMFLLPSYIGDGSIEAFVPLFRDNLEKFKEICYVLD